MNEIQIKSWEELTKIFNSNIHRNRFWIYRGQENKSWNLSPSIEREGLKTFESEIIKSFQRNAHLYMDITNLNGTIEWLSILQHFGAPTRLLDWTYSPFVSAFFAMINKSVESEDAVIWALNIDSLIDKAKSISEKIKGFSFLTSQKYRFDRELEDDEFKKLFMSDDFSPFVLPISPKKGHERLNTQQGIFLCQTNFSKTYQENLDNAINQLDDENNFLKILIPSSMKPVILDQLRQMNINYSTLFPGLEGFIKSLTLKHQIFKDGDLRELMNTTINNT